MSNLKDWQMQANLVMPKSWKNIFKGKGKLTDRIAKYFNVVNKKIIVRHLMGTCLGYFFRKYPEYFKTLESLVISGGGIDKFNKYMEEYKIDNKEIYGYIYVTLVMDPISKLFNHYYIGQKKCKKSGIVVLW